MPPQKPQRKLSTRLIRTGALIEETYAIFQHWDTARTIRENLNLVLDTNPIGAGSSRWLREVTKTIASRFTDPKRILPLVAMARGRVGMDIWKPCLLYHIGSTDELYFRFAAEWLYPAYSAGTYILLTPDVEPFVHKITDGKLARGRSLSPDGARRHSQDLLRMATDFGLLKGNVRRTFNTPFHLPEECFLYVLHALVYQYTNAHAAIHAPEWRLFLKEPADVERELLHLHQYHKLHYQAAGSLVQLDLPHASLLAYAESLAA